MSYLPSGTNYPTQVTYYLPGLYQDGADYVATVVNTTGSNGPLVGSSGNWTMNAKTSKIFYELTGALGATGVVIVLPVVASGQSLNGTEAGISPSVVKIYDVAGGFAANNVTVSGGVGTLINGATTQVLATNYQVATFTNVTGNTWLKS